MNFERVSDPTRGGRRQKPVKSMLITPSQNRNTLDFNQLMVNMPKIGSLLETYG